jgi:hypothetical protein
MRLSSPSPRPTREELIGLLDASAEPVGPEVFAGYGGDIARLRHEIIVAAGDPLRGVIEAESRVDVLVAVARRAPELARARLRRCLRHATADRLVADVLACLDED